MRSGPRSGLPRPPAPRRRRRSRRDDRSGRCSRGRAAASTGSRPATRSRRPPAWPLERDDAGADSGERRHDEVVGALGLVLAGEMSVTEVDGRLDPRQPVERLVQEVRAEVHLVADVARCPPRRGTSGPPASRASGSSSCTVSAPAARTAWISSPEHADAVAHELLALRVRGPRVLRVPHPAADDVGRRQGGLDAAARPRAHVPDLGSHDLPVVLDRRHDRRVGEPAARIDVGPEAADAVGEDLDVALAAPLAVGDLVDAGPLLEADGAVDGGIQESIGLRLAEPSGLSVEDDVADPGRPRQTADDGGGEEPSRHRESGGSQGRAGRRSSSSRSRRATTLASSPRRQ